MGRTIATVIISMMSLVITGQQVIDGSFAFQTDPAKEYAIYLPASYDGSESFPMMVGFHPLNTNRWDAHTWRDTLIDFAEENNLILLCPDGGPDGRVDDAIDTAFTTTLIDSSKFWFNVNIDKIYAMGFSWGGRTVYTYGLHHINQFAGLMPIGAAIDGTAQFFNVVHKVAGKPIAIIHGENDSPALRFFPAKTAMIDNQACVSDTLMPGIGHTIDFPNRNQILSEAFSWLQDNACTSTSNTNELNLPDCGFTVAPNPSKEGQQLQLKSANLKQIDFVWILSDQSGRLVRNGKSSDLDRFPKLQVGIYFLEIKGLGCGSLKKIVVTE